MQCEEATNRISKLESKQTQHIAEIVQLKKEIEQTKRLANSRAKELEEAKERLDEKCQENCEYESKIEELEEQLKSKTAMLNPLLKTRFEKGKGLNTSSRLKLDGSALGLYSKAKVVDITNYEMKISSLEEENAKLKEMIFESPKVDQKWRKEARSNDSILI